MCKYRGEKSEPPLLASVSTEYISTYPSLIYPIFSQVLAFKDLDRLGTEKQVKEAGLLKSEGKEYVMREGDVVLFRFN
jgi:hypothetical protein